MPVNAEYRGRRMGRKWREKSAIYDVFLWVGSLASPGLGAMHSRSQMTPERQGCNANTVILCSNSHSDILKVFPTRHFPLLLLLPIGAHKPRPAESARTIAVHTAAAASPPQRAR